MSNLTTYTAGDDNRYTAVSGATIAHDARGNVTTWDGKTFGYDADNRLVSAAATGLTMTFAYDGDGRLVKLVKNGVTEYRFYDGAQCFLRTDGNGTALDWTVWGPTPDEVIARNVSGAWQYYHQDQINSVYAVTNAAGSVLERYLYDPFGLPDVRNASWSALGTASAIGNPWLFTGQEWRSDLGLSNYKARWYQPSLGRFMQNDPVRFDAGDINLYRYCFNNPANLNDPTGNFAGFADTGPALSPQQRAQMAHARAAQGREMVAKMKPSEKTANRIGGAVTMTTGVAAVIGGVAALLPPVEAGSGGTSTFIAVTWISTGVPLAWAGAAQLISGEPTISSVGDVVAEATGSKEAGIAVDLAMVAVDAKNLAKVSTGATDLIGQADAAKTVVEAAIEISAPTPKEEKR